MSQTQPGNSEYLGQIVNTDLSKSAVSNAIGDSAVGSLRVVNGSVDVDDLTAATDGVATNGQLTGGSDFIILKDKDGHYIQLSEGDHITLVSNIGSSLVGGATAVVAFNLSEATASSNGDGLISSGTPVAFSADSGALSADLALGAVQSYVVPAGAVNYLALESKTDDVTAGVINYALHIVKA